MPGACLTLTPPPYPPPHQVLRRIALEYLQYEESGATCWDTMIDVRTLALTQALALTLRLSLRLTGYPQP